MKKQKTMNNSFLLISNTQTMAKSIRIQLLIVMLALFTQAALLAQNPRGVVPGKLTVKIDQATFDKLNQTRTYVNNKGIAVTSMQEFDELNENFKVAQWERVFPESPKYEARHRKHGLHLWYQISFDSSVPVSTVLNSFKGAKGVTFVEPSYEKELIPYKFTPFEGTSLKRSTSNFNDPMLAEQWHYNNTGQSEGTAGADIRLFDAWKISTGTPNVIVSVHDEGVDFTHEDLAANMYVNIDEFNGEAGVDDDKNGYVDDIHGYNFRANNGNIVGEMHGTHVAGTVAAVNNNGVGVAGVAGGSGTGDGVRIMSCQIFGNANIGRTYIYAADNGAVISQNSWGYSNPGYVEESVLAGIDYFIAEAGNYPGSPMKGGVVIFAAGNSDYDAEWYPQYYEKVIAVGSLGPKDEKAYYSNFGNWLEISAPGGNPITNANQNVLSTLPKNKYGWMSGTSMACPHVSGIAALIVSKYGNASFTNEDLRKHLLTGYRNIDATIPDHVGLMGKGAADANMALQANDNTGPNKITTLNVIGIAQDFAKVKWTSTADPNDLSTEMYQVLWNTDSITPENISTAYSKSIEKRVMAGEELQMEITDLMPLTKYYFAVRSFDRWGNASALSNIAIANTNSGPKILLDPQTINLEVDVQNSPTLSSSFNIKNLDEGLLKWHVVARHATFSPAWNKIERPDDDDLAAIMRAYANPKIVKHKADIQNRIIKPMAINDTEMGYTSAWWDIYTIGEEDTSITNSAALKFYVSQENGFNLTTLSLLLNHEAQYGPMVIELYSGTLDQKNLIHIQEFNAWSAGPQSHYVQLTNQLYFEHGETFWVVVHAPRGSLYPLGMGGEDKPEYSDNALMSFDHGKRWIPIEEAIMDDRYVWAFTAMSGNMHLGNYITLSPSTGETVGNGTSEVNFEVNASELINGDYNARLAVQSNDANVPLAYTDVFVSVKNHKPILNTDDIVDFGVVFLGTSKTVEIPVKNIGLGNFSGLNGINLMLSNQDFELVGWAPWSISAKSEQTIKFKYAATKLGSSNTKVTLSDDKGYEYSFMLFAVGAEPAKIVTNPVFANYTGVSIGDTLSGEFMIKNIGNYPLKYLLPSFTENIPSGNNNERFHKYGYTTNNAATYEWNDISATGTEVTDFFADTRNRYMPVEIGFSFPFYDMLYESIYITDYGVLSFDTNSSFNRMPGSLYSQDSPNGFISALFFELQTAEGSRIFYKRESGKLIVQYNGMYNTWSAVAPYTFQIVIFDSGNVKIYVNDIESIDSYSRESFFFAIEEPEHQDGIEISSYEKPIEVYNQTAFEFIYPGMNMISEISSSEGIIQPGDSTVLDYTIHTTGLNQGFHKQALGILSNDPFKPVDYHYINLNITKGGVAQFLLNKTSLDFGSVFQHAQTGMEVYSSNNKTKDVTISSVALMFGTHFSFEGLTSFIQKPGNQEYFKVKLLTTELGSYTDTLIFSLQSGSTRKIALSGTVVDAPGITVNLTTITDTLMSGKNVAKGISVTNSGKNDLNYSIRGLDWLKHSTSATPTDGGQYSYTYKKSTEPDGPSFKWIDIRTTGTKYGVMEFFDEPQDQNAWKPIPIMFDFEFYGVKYDTLYTSANGLLSTQKWDLVPFWPDFIPSETEPNGFIAPLWAQGGLGMTSPDDDRPAVFYQHFADYTLVSFINLYNMFGMGEPVDAQVFLYKDGSMKFQYRTNGWDRVSSQSVVGLENLDGTDGEMIYAFQTFDMNNLAIMVSPTRMYTLAPAAKNVHSLTLDASNLNGGDFAGSYDFITNVPNKENLSKKVNLNVKGMPEMMVADSFAFGKVLAYESVDEWGNPAMKQYYQNFNIQNSGSANLEISALYLANPTETMLEMLIYDPWSGNMWAPVDNPLWQPIMITPGQSMEFRLTLTPTGTITAIQDTLHVVSNAVNQEKLIPVSATIGLPAVAVVTPNKFMLEANDFSLVENKTFSVENQPGGDQLTFTAKVIYASAASSEASSIISKFADNKAVTLGKGNASSNSSIKSTADYNRTLQHDNAITPESALGFGLESSFVGATRFTAPDNGFNLTHISTYYLPEGMPNGEIIVEILAGASIEDATTVYTEKFTGPADGTSQLVTFKLAQSQLFLAGQNFYVAISYPLGIAYPQGVVSIAPAMDNTFFYLSEGAWEDLSESDFKDFGWMVRAHEEAFVESGWITLSAEADTLQPGEKADIQATIKSATAVRGANKAYIVVSSNDVFTPEQMVEVILHVNEAPVYLSYPRTPITASENTEVRFEVKMHDNEGDTFTLENAGSQSNISLTSENNVYTIAYTPDFDAAGMDTIHLKATDQHNAVSQQMVMVNIANTNRAPVATDPGTINVDKDGSYATIKFAEIFSDPDGDEMSYSFTTSNTDKAIVAANAEELVLLLQKTGAVNITITATDIYDESASLELSINIISTGVESILAQHNFSIFPNPTAGATQAAFKLDAGADVEIAIFDFAGKQIYSHAAGNLGAGPQIVDFIVPQVEKGVYLIELKANSQIISTQKLIIK